MANNCFIDITLVKPQVKPEIIIHPDDGITPSILFDNFGIFDVALETDSKGENYFIRGWVKWNLTEEQFKKIILRFQPEECNIIVEELMNGVYGEYYFKFPGKYRERFLDNKEIIDISEQYKDNESYSKMLNDCLEDKEWQDIEFD